MKRSIVAVVMVAVMMPVLALAQEAAAPKTEKGQEAGALKTEKEKLSYAMGMDLAGQLKANAVEVDPAAFAKGMADLLGGRKTLLTEAEAKTIISELQKAMIVKRTAEAKASGEKNKVEGEKFLAANKAKEGVVTLPSGLQYKPITTGTGPKPTPEQTVVCNYRGTLIDGKEFDSSYKRGQPATFPVKGVIKGWTEVLQLMPVGSKWQVFIPSNLAYGEKGAGLDIGPHATLIFEIELVAVK